MGMGGLWEALQGQQEREDFSEPELGLGVSLGMLAFYYSDSRFILPTS